MPGLKHVGLKFMIKSLRAGRKWCWMCYIFARLHCTVASQECMSKGVVVHTFTNNTLEAEADGSL